MLDFISHYTDNPSMLNKALAMAVIDSGKKKKTIARLARMTASDFSKVLHNKRPATETEIDRLAQVLKRQPVELFPEAVVAV